MCDGESRQGGNVGSVVGNHRTLFFYMPSEVRGLGLLFLLSERLVSLLRCFMNRGRNLNFPRDALKFTTEGTQSSQLLPVA